MTIHDRFGDKRAFFFKVISHLTMSNEVEPYRKKILGVLRANVDVHCISINDFN